MPRILLTGFSPFSGRSINASWVAVASLQQHLSAADVHAIELPVQWGMPAPILDKYLGELKPEIVIAMGEGKPGCFQLETLAVNRRADRADNTGSYPPFIEIIKAGPGSLKSGAPLGEIRGLLQGRGVPALLSVDAGGFLCEETLFALEYLKKHHDSVRIAMFVHLPPYGTTLSFKGNERACDHPLLLEFAQDLLEVVSELLSKYRISLSDPV